MFISPSPSHLSRTPLSMLSDVSSFQIGHYCCHKSAIVQNGLLQTSKCLRSYMQIARHPPVPRYAPTLATLCGLPKRRLERHIPPVSDNAGLSRSAHHQLTYVAGVWLPDLHPHVFRCLASTALARWVCSGLGRRHHFNKVGCEEMDATATSGTLDDNEHPSVCRIA